MTRASRLHDVVRLEASGGQASVTAVGLDCRVISYIPAEGDLAPCYVGIAPLEKVLRQRQVDLPVEVAIEEQRLLVTHGEYRLRLPLQRNDFQLSPPVHTDVPGALDFQRFLATVVVVPSEDDKTGILLDWNDGRLALVAFSRRAHAHLAVAQCPPGSGRFCLSTEAARQLVKLGDLTAWWLEGDFLWARSVFAAMRVSPVRDAYPRDYLDVLKDDYAVTCRFSCSALTAALKSVAVVLSKDEYRVMLAAVGTVERGGQKQAVFELRSASFNGQKAVERVLGQTGALAAWEGEISAPDLATSLGVVGDSVGVSFGRKSIVLDDGCLRAYLTTFV